MNKIRQTNLHAPSLHRQDVSVPRKMSAALPRLREIAKSKNLDIHHLGAGYPHPEVTDPRSFLAHKKAYFEQLDAANGPRDPQQLPDYLRESFSYTDTLGPRRVREVFCQAYGNDWGVSLNPDRMLPTVGATGGISLICSLFERAGEPVAYITDAPTYAGFTARVGLCRHASIFSVEMDDEGPIPEQFVAQVKAAREAGNFVPFYYTVPDGHNPAGFSFSQSRREKILEIAREEGLLIVEDAPYVYISYVEEASRPRPFVSMAADQTVHLFTGSKIGFPGPRIGFLYSEAEVTIAGGGEVGLSELALTESSAEILFQNPWALRGFESLLHDRQFQPRTSLWPLAERKLAVYRDNREIMLSGFEALLGAHRDCFDWTVPDGGFFSVFTFKQGDVVTDDDFIEWMVSEHGLVTIPMYDFYPDDARRRNPKVGLNQLRLSFSFSESRGEDRRDDMAKAVATFCGVALQLVGRG